MTSAGLWSWGAYILPVAELITGESVLSFDISLPPAVPEVGARSGDIKSKDLTPSLKVSRGSGDAWAFVEHDGPYLDGFQLIDLDLVARAVAIYR